MVPKLPIEIVDCIIDEVTHISLTSEYPRPARKRDLSSCALVCRDWLYRSRQNLFHSVRITGARDILDLKNTLDKVVLDGRTVHDLSICHEEVLRAYDPMQLSQALSYLTALQLMDVEFVNLGFPAHSYHVKHAPLPLSKLRRLTLTWVAAKTFASFILLVEAFPCLTHLTLSDCSVRVVPDDDDCVPPDVEWTPRLPQLRSVKLIHADTYMPLAALQRWISVSPLFSSLIRFTLSPGNDLSPNLYRLKEAKSAAVLLKRRGNMLQKLRLNAFLFDRYWISDICRYNILCNMPDAYDMDNRYRLAKLHIPAEVFVHSCLLGCGASALD